MVSYREIQARTSLSVCISIWAKAQDTVSFFKRSVCSRKTCQILSCCKIQEGVTLTHWKKKKTCFIEKSHSTCWAPMNHRSSKPRARSVCTCSGLIPLKQACGAQPVWPRPRSALDLMPTAFLGEFLFLCGFSKWEGLKQEVMQQSIQVACL